MNLSSKFTNLNLNLDLGISGFDNVNQLKYNYTVIANPV